MQKKKQQILSNNNNNDNDNDKMEKGTKVNVKRKTGMCDRRKNLATSLI